MYLNSTVNVEKNKWKTRINGKPVHEQVDQTYPQNWSQFGGNI